MASIIHTYFENALLSMAAYADLAEGMTRDLYITELKAVGFTNSLAEQFADTYSIAADTFSNAQGLAVNLLQKTGSTEKVLAIRGDGRYQYSHGPCGRWTHRHR